MELVIADNRTIKIDPKNVRNYKVWECNGYKWVFDEDRYHCFQKEVPQRMIPIDKDCWRIIERHYKLMRLADEDMTPYNFALMCKLEMTR